MSVDSPQGRISCDEWCAMILVCDGRGEFGHEVSACAVHILKKVPAVPSRRRTLAPFPPF